MHEVLGGEMGREQEGAEEFQMIPSHQRVSWPSITCPGWQEYLSTDPGVTGNPSQECRGSRSALSTWSRGEQPGLTQIGMVGGIQVLPTHTALGRSSYVRM